MYTWSHDNTPVCKVVPRQLIEIANLLRFLPVIHTACRVHIPLPKIEEASCREQVLTWYRSLFHLWYFEPFKPFLSAVISGNATCLGEVILLHINGYIYGLSRVSCREYTEENPNIFCSYHHSECIWITNNRWLLECYWIVTIHYQHKELCCVMLYYII